MISKLDKEQIHNSFKGNNFTTQLFRNLFQSVISDHQLRIRIFKSFSHISFITKNNKRVFSLSYTICNSHHNVSMENSVHIDHSVNNFFSSSLLLSITFLTNFNHPPISSNHSILISPLCYYFYHYCCTALWLTWLHCSLLVPQRQCFL